jgi:2-polyprenyl-3-methyl-5-hydroxy-6-metoxy-1,4-benzoquinol methylase
MNEDVYIRTAKSCRNHWWFKSRVLILDSIIKNLKLKKNIKILDYGSGVGSNITMLKKHGNVDALEPHIPTAILLKRSFKIKIIKKLKLKYDLIFLTDVIEHVKNDKKKVVEAPKKSVSKKEDSDDSDDSEESSEPPKKNDKKKVDESDDDSDDD